MPLLERSCFLQSLASAFSGAVTGTGSAHFILGEAGIGKTALVRAFLQSTGGRARTFTALCDPLFTPRPLGPLYDLAAGLRLEDGRSLSDYRDRGALFGAVAAALTDRAEPVVLLFEDLHWADEATLDFIQYFVRRIADKPCLLIGTARLNELTPVHPMAQVLGRLPAGSYTRHELPLLTRGAVAELSAAHGRKGNCVWRLSGGNPFYVTELLAAPEDSVPRHVRDTILASFQLQPEADRAAWQLLSVMPEGLDEQWIAGLEPAFQEAIDNGIARGVLQLCGKRVLFRHELYRRAIEESLTPLRARQWAAEVLCRFGEHFRAEGALERIVHYARAAGDRTQVALHAPAAAARAAGLGAHVEAARLYDAALEVTTDADARLPLLEAHAYECYLTSRLPEAIASQQAALKMWEDRGDIARSANALRFLSRLWWYNGKRYEAEAYGQAAVERFAPLPPSREKAMALSNRAQLAMLADNLPCTLRWGGQAIEMATAFGDRETLSHALNNVGTAQSRFPEYEVEGMARLEQALQLALEDGMEEHAARAYTNLATNHLLAGHLEEAARWLEDGLAYCTDRDLHAWMRYKLWLKSRLLLDTGRWPEARAVAEGMLADPLQPPIARIGALVVAGTIAVRTGAGDAPTMLRAARDLAFVSDEHQRVVPVLIAMLEWEWISGEVLATDEDLDRWIALVSSVDRASFNAEGAWWLRRVRPHDNRLDAFYREELLPRTRAYEGALLQLGGDESAQHAALTTLETLGADAARRRVMKQLKRSGAKGVPRGMRAATRENPAGLTPRQMDILRLLPTGAPNKSIAETLFISAKTVEHHVSAILEKLEVPTRLGAVHRAGELGII